MIRARYVVERHVEAGWQVTDRALPHGRSTVAWTATHDAARAIARAHEVQRIADLARVARLGGVDQPELSA
jgi:hypothetical protein